VIILVPKNRNESRKKSSFEWRMNLEQKTTSKSIFKGLSESDLVLSLLAKSGRLDKVKRENTERIVDLVCLCVVYIPEQERGAITRFGGFLFNRKH
jgi:hypothetical protein